MKGVWKWTDELDSVGIGSLLEVFWGVAVFAPGAYEVAIDAR